MGSRAKPQPARPGGKPTGSGMNVQQVKVVLLGDQGVGKSSIALRFVRGEFLEHGEATIGAAFLTQTTKIDNHVIKFDIWDTAGQERYHSLAPMYYRGAQAAIIVYDVTSENSFKRALVWIKELQQQANAHIFVVLAGNKADMASEERAVPIEDARIYAEENDLFFVETSAKTGMAVTEVFMAVANRLAGQGKRSGSQQQQQRGNPNVHLGDDAEEGRKKAGCC